MKSLLFFTVLISLQFNYGFSQVNYTFEYNFWEYNKQIERTDTLSLDFGSPALRLKNEGLAFSAMINNDQALISIDSKFMHGYMELYRSTGDIAYLKIFVKHAENILNRRDDNNSSTAGINTPTWTTYRYSEAPNKDVPYAWLYHDGLLTYPLADFAQEVKNNPALHSITADTYDPVVEFGNLPLETPYSFEGDTFIEIANFILDRVEETIEYHHDNGEWVPETEGGIEEGHYRFVWDAAHDISDSYDDGDYIPLNMQSAMGRTLLMMFKATGDNFYLDKVRRLANNLRDNIVENGSYPTQYLWYYDDADDSNPYTGVPYSEDLSHAGINAHFMYLCYKENIQYDVGGSGPVFDLTDMQKIAATFKNTYINPLNFWEDIHKTYSVGGNWENLGLWTPYSEFDKDIYHIIADVHARYTEVNPSFTGPPDPKHIEAFAMLDLYQNLFNIIYIGKNGSASEWIETAVGDFNNDGIKEIAAVRNFDGDIYIWEFIGGEMVLAQTINYGSSSNWKGLDIGNVDGIPGDELILIRDFDNTIFVFKNSGAAVNLVEMVSARKLMGSLTNWKGIATGDFDGDNKDEYATINNTNGNTFVFELNGSNQTILKTTLLNGSASDWAGIAAGNLDGAGNDEIVQVRNFDGNIYAYKYNNLTSELETFASPKIYNNNSLGWKGIELGDFDSDCKDEIIANMASDGDHYFYEIDNVMGGLEIVSKNREHFVTDLENGIIATGQLSSNCGPNDELVNFRNQDGWVNIYEVTLGNCALCEQVGGNTQRQNNSSQISPSQNMNTQPLIVIYPNPTNSGNFQIQTNELLQVKVFDLLGNLLINLEANRDLINIELSEFEKGTYIAQITTAQGVYSEKIIYE